MSKIVHFMDQKRQRFLERFPPKMRFIAANAVLQVVRENRDTSDPQELLAILKLLLFVRLDWVDVMKLEPESWTLWKRPGEQAAFIMLRMIFEEPEAVLEALEWAVAWESLPLDKKEAIKRSRSKK